MYDPFIHDSSDELRRVRLGQPRTLIGLGGAKQAIPRDISDKLARMDQSLTQLCRFFVAARERGRALVLASMLRTEGSTYRKAGARVLIDADGQMSGTLSGGCLEADIRERVLRVIKRERAERVWFDTRRSEDPVWGLGMGCEGAMDVWLQPELPQHGYPVMSYLQECLAQEHEGAIATVVGGAALPQELGAHAFLGSDPTDSAPAELRLLLQAKPPKVAELQRLRIADRELEAFVAPVELPTQLLICGAGGDAIPVHALAASLGWRVTVFDHRPAYATAAHFPQAARVICARPEELAQSLATARFDAAVVMSHHLSADATYLRLLAAQAPRYIGLLGPAHRRQRLLSEVGAAAHSLGARLHGPAGLDIGAGTPESIALAIIAQIHAVLSGKPGGPFEPTPA
jgi:xanthine/CO dehydrogenase XdhC/CoxF family maturation factor